ncbi:flavin reductase [Anaerotardibacter muris]|uniref:flavin reductase n=1 Tax=Anaerotardibacter muris TaxID=2941505 RepID=UPI002040461A|nr:flavin reductase [Anaerotardibacter muris]
MIDKNAFRNLSYGLYLISSVKDGRPVGCVVNTFAQVTSDPPQVSIAINKDNYTTQGILESGMFEVVVLHKDAPMEVIGTFGFHCSKDFDKFVDIETKVSSQGITYVAEAGCAHFSVKVNQQLDLGTHIFFVGDVIEADIIGEIEPMTYAYYHEVKGGRTPKNASSFSTDALEAEAGSAPEAASSGKKTTRIGWRCQLCGYIEFVDELPEDFVCPVCGATREFFERVEVEVEA